MRPFVSSFILIAALFHGRVNAFTTVQPAAAPHGYTSSGPTTTSCSIRRRTTHLAASERREVFGLARKVVGVVTASLFTFSKTAKAIVNDNESVNGRIITFTVNNLGGEEGKTGTFKIQTAPTWAPKGVARFEVGDSQCACTTIAHTVRYCRN